MGQTSRHCSPAVGCLSTTGWLSNPENPYALTASSELNSQLNADAALPTSSYSWSARTNDDNQWVQADLGRVMMVEALSTWSRADDSQWVTAYNVSHSLDGTTWSWIIDPLDYYNGYDVIVHLPYLSD